MDQEVIFEHDKIEPINLEREMRQYFIDYAMSVIVARALPDVRDGLKPVQRRILYSMNELSCTPDKPHRKSARISGDTMGKYHPHGDSSIYESMVHMAQDWAMRYMLVDGHGNFGSIDGDGAAAARYTEARLSKISMELLTDINKDTVDFVPNYDGTLKEPTVLPARFPNLLVNGTTGIAVGMATSIPPHNLGEVIDACSLIIDNRVIGGRETTIDEVMEVIKGPDFPTGATIYGTHDIDQAYRTGHGRCVVRSVAEIEDVGSKQRIVITEIPYQVNKATLVSTIADLVKDKRIEGISDLRDESNLEGYRIVIDLKRDAHAQVILNQLYKNTPLQSTVSINMLCIVNGEPRVLNLLQMLTYYLEHQKEVVKRRTQFDLDKAQARAHILEGLLKALDYIDEIISIIRSSQTVQEAKDAMMARYGLDDIQAQAIVEMRLRALTGMERERLQAEFDDLQAKISEYLAILSSDNLQYNIVKQELLAIKAKYADNRRTHITYEEGEINLEDLIKNELCVVTMTKLGYMKRTSLDMYRSQNRGGKGIKALETRDGDYVEDMYICSSHDYLLMFTNKGRVYRIKAYDIPEAGRAARGVAAVNFLSISGDEKITACIMMKEKADEGYLFMATRKGTVKKTSLSEFENIRGSGMIAIKLADDDDLIEVKKSSGNDRILMATQNGLLIQFEEEDVRPTGRATMGVRGITLNDDDVVIGAQLASEGTSVLVASRNGMGKRTNLDEFGCQGRGGKGHLYYRITPKTGDIISFKMVNEDDELMLINSNNITIRQNAGQISLIGRVTSGVKLMDLEPGVQIVALAVVPTLEDPKDAPEAETAPAEPAFTQESLL